GVLPVRIHIAGVCVTSRNVAKVSSDFRHTAVVFITGRRVAKSSSAFRIPNTEAKTFRADNTWDAGPWKTMKRLSQQVR
ncbi:MAG: hypothetical protein Q8912_02055, partial [Bacillota bacterium]|nr:hypothetical protein [Bacillota bacterium]